MVKKIALADQIRGLSYGIAWISSHFRLKPGFSISLSLARALNILYIV